MNVLSSLLASGQHALQTCALPVQNKEPSDQNLVAHDTCRVALAYIREVKLAAPKKRTKNTLKRPGPEQSSNKNVV